MAPVRCGLDLLLAEPAAVGDRRWALLANHAAVTSELQPARTALQRAGLGPLVRLFAPEHGLNGTAQDMEAVEDQRDRVTGAPVRSLYGRTAATLAPRPRDLDGIDTVLIDLPDIGTRYYTFAATMDAVMAACQTAGLPVVVLDRPNPIGGDRREGGMVQDGFESFVSQLPVPIRHGLTLAEIALLLQQDRYPELELTVLPCEGWQRDQWWNETGLPWVPPSPNMPTPETALIYPGLCLVEATTLSEGRGTTRPFHLVGAPWIDAGVLTERLGALRLPGVAFRPACFRPMFGKHAGNRCWGVEIHVRSRRDLQPVALGLRLLQVIYDLYPKSFSWRREAYEFVSDRPAIDLLTGSEEARHCIESGRPFTSLTRRWDQELERFNRHLAGHLLYP